MKKLHNYVGLMPILLMLLSASSMKSQSPAGAWKNTSEEIQSTLIITEQYFSVAHYKTDEFVSTYGGSWYDNGNGVSLRIEFDTEDSTNVGKKVDINADLDGNRLYIDNDSWSRIDAGDPGQLAGAWLFSGRKRNGDIQRRNTDQPRKTMKILSGTRFQWIAYNTETKQFMGTGGGTYTTVDGKYTETIDFFSRDNDRVGAVLPFDFSIVDGEWHHSGKSSKGADMFEIWKKRM